MKTLFVSSINCANSSQSNPQGLLISMNKDLTQPQKKHFMIECTLIWDNPVKDQRSLESPLLPK